MTTEFQATTRVAPAGVSSVLDYGTYEQVVADFAHVDPQRISEACVAYQKAAQNLGALANSLKAQAAVPLAESWSDASAEGAQHQLQLAQATAESLATQCMTMAHALDYAAQYAQWYKDKLPQKSLWEQAGLTDSSLPAAVTHTHNLLGRYREVIGILPPQVQAHVTMSSAAQAAALAAIGAGAGAAAGGALASRAGGTAGAAFAGGSASGSGAAGSLKPLTGSSGQLAPGAGAGAGAGVGAGAGADDLPFDGGSVLAGAGPGSGLGAGPGGAAGSGSATVGGVPGAGGVPGGVGSGAGLGPGLGAGALGAGALGATPGGQSVLGRWGAGMRGLTGGLLSRGMGESTVTGPGAAGGAVGEDGALSRGANSRAGRMPGVIGDEAVGAGSRPGMSPMMGGLGGGQQDRERERSTWLTEDEDVWGGDNDAAPPVISG